ncbi:TIM21 [Auxenochlorella protothecoides x Auxenochlorella symbiontica]
MFWCFPNSPAGRWMLDDFPHASQFAAAVLYAAVNELLLQPAEYTCYNKTLDLIRDDPRVTVRLGEPVHAYGTESRNRSARQRIPHREYQDVEGRQHIQIQFHLSGPSGRATVNADMYLESGAWKHNFLYLDVQEPIRQQVVLVRPEVQMVPAA